MTTKAIERGTAIHHEIARGEARGNEAAIARWRAMSPAERRHRQESWTRFLRRSELNWKMKTVEEMSILEFTARIVPARYGSDGFAFRCVMCGDKIKPIGGTEEMIEIDLPGGPGYLEIGCRDYYENGHPDMPWTKPHRLVFVDNTENL